MTWGPGNFDNDSATYFLESFVKNLVETVRNTISLHDTAKSDDWFYESHGETRLMPAVDLLLTIVTSYDVSVHILTELTANEINNWKQEYLTVFDAVIDRYSGDKEYTIDRRQVIASTFEKLESFVEKYDE